METLSTKTLIANQSPTAILNCAHNRAKLEYRKTHSDTLLTQAVTRIKLRRPCDTFPTFQLECFPFTDQTFVSSRLQIWTSWLSPISATTSTFVLCLLLWTRLSNFNFCMLQHLSFRTTTFTTFAFAFNSQPLTLQCFRFVQLSALSTFPSAIFPLRHFFFPFWFYISLGILFSFGLFSFTFICPMIFFLISCLFLLQFNSAVTKIQTSRSMFQRLPWSNSPVVVLRSML